MTNTQPQASPEIASQDSTWSSASKLSGKVRELAHRSHRALKAWTRSQANPDDIGDDLRDLRVQIARLNQKIHDRRLDALIPWVDALQRQVEDRLGNKGKAGPR
jgi:septal ring factor EnvC (AmiA/AmiB activator)